MHLLVDAAVIAIIAYAIYAGTRRGGILIGLELLSFGLATAVALIGYRALGSAMRDISGSIALANVAGFMVLWVATEVAASLIIRYMVLPHLPKLPKAFTLSRPSQVLGGALNGAKSLLLLVLALVLWSGMPLTATAKRAVTDANIPTVLLGSSGQLQRWLAGGLGRDLNESLTIFTVPSDPESERRVELGFTTTRVRTDAAAEEAMLRLINRERAQHGLKALTLHKDARTVARAYSHRMLAEGYFSHRDNDGKTPFDRLRAGGVRYSAAGENLALAPTLALAHQGLMNSPGHRANILSRDYGRVGIGVIDAGRYGLMITQNFTD